MKKYRNTFLKIMTCFLIMIMVTSFIPTEEAFAYFKKAENPSKVTSFESTTNKDYERIYCNITDGTKLVINYQTPIKSDAFKVSLYCVSGSSSLQGDVKLNKVVKAKEAKNAYGETLYKFKKTLDFEDLDVSNGYYNLYIQRGKLDDPEISSEYTFDNVGICYKNMEILVRNDSIYICKYNDVISYNNDVMSVGKKFPTSKYLDQSLEDIRFVLRNPATNVYATMTPEKIDYMKSISNRICSGEGNNYRKLLRMYEYVASNFYYDSIAFTTHSMQFADPYENVYNFENGLSSDNSVDGKVYTTCQGFSAIMVSFARAQEIPARLVYGHRLSIPNLDWRLEGDLDVRDHWWLEAYVGGKWIFIDPTIGTSNKYNKNTKVFAETGLTNYTFFNPTKEQISTSHVYMNVFPDYRFGKYLTNPYEEQKIIEFLNTEEKSDGNRYYTYYGSNTRGKLLDPYYDINDKETWGDGIKSHFMTDGKGNVEQIQWSNKGFSGEASLPKFEYMTLLSMRNNSFESVDLSGCKRISKIYLDGNPLKSLKYYFNKKDRTITSNGHGTFGIKLLEGKSKPLTIYSKPDLGYKVGSIVNKSNGRTLSKKKTYVLKPECLNIIINFVPNPESYVYYLSPERLNDKSVCYLQAVTKRLYELGYYTPYDTSIVGNEKYMTSGIVESVKKFQVVNDINNTGNVGRNTWEILFNEIALSMPSDHEYQVIKDAYDQRKILEEQAKLEMEGASETNQLEAPQNDN